MMLSLMSAPVGLDTPSLVPRDGYSTNELRRSSSERQRAYRDHRRSSAVELAAVDGQHLAGDGRSQVGGEEERGPGDFLRGRVPLQVGRRRLLGVHLLVRLVLHRAEEVEVAAVD